MSSFSYDELLARLEKRVWVTRGSRFKAVKRLNSKHYWSITSISFLSVCGISIPILQSSLGTSSCPKIQSIYSVIATISSVFILVLSLLEGYRNYQVKAERLYINALDLSHICRQIEFLKVSTLPESEKLEKLESLSYEYEKLIKLCQENHDTEDYLLFRIDNRQEFGIPRAEAWTYPACSIIRNYWLYFISIIVFPIPIIVLYLSC